MINIQIVYTQWSSCYPFQWSYSIDHLFCPFFPVIEEACTFVRINVKGVSPWFKKRGFICKAFSFKSNSLWNCNLITLHRKFYTWSNFWHPIITPQLGKKLPFYFMTIPVQITMIWCLVVSITHIQKTFEIYYNHTFTSIKFSSKFCDPLLENKNPLVQLEYQ